MSNVLEILKERGFVDQMTHEAEIARLLSEEKVIFYNGFDPTADSLHIGHMRTFMALAWMQRGGHVPVILMGGGTGMVGDPDKADSMRPLMDVAEIDRNVELFKTQAQKFIDFSEGGAIMANNADWLRHLNYVDFIREYGVHFSVNRMLAADKYRVKFEGAGLNFFELNYVVMQAYDFLELNRRFGCVLQTGGSDQWSNIIAGVELIRRVEQRPAYGLTFSLLLRSDGAKMGKTMGGTVWLDGSKTTPFEFYQYFRNTPDSEVRQYLAMFTFLPMDKILELTERQGAELNAAKEVLAFEVTKLVHGEDEAAKARGAARALFAGGSAADAPSVKITREQVAEGLNVVDLTVLAGLAPSKSEARRLISQGGLALNGKRVDVGHLIVPDDFDDTGSFVLQKGKKVFRNVQLIDDR